MIKKLFSMLYLLIIASFTMAQILEPVKWTQEIQMKGDKTADVIFHASIEEGWHLYGLQLPKDGPRATSVVFKDLVNVTKIGELKSSSKLLKAFDANFNMELNWYVQEAIFVQKITFTDASKISVGGYIEFMACNDKSCLPPKQVPFKLGKLIAENASTPVTNLVKSNVSQKPAASSIASPDSAQLWKPVIAELGSFASDKADEAAISLWFIFFAGMLGGFLALFTPCVWPIIPMTVSFFLKRSENKSRGQRDAILYGLAIIFIYVVLGLLITLLFGASALNSLSTNAIFNLLFFALMVLFAVSFFGAFEITLPASWSTKMDAKADSTAGILSILFMAFTLVLVSFSCTGPIIGTLLVQVSSTGSFLAPAIGMLGFSVALSIPFSLFALFPSWLKTLPRSGGWLNSVKVVLGFLELALALKFLSVADLAYGWHILDREVFLVLWIVIFALLGMYLLGKIRFSHDSPSQHTSVLGVFLAIVSFSFSLYLVPGLWGAPLKAISAFAPPLYTQDFNLTKEELHPAFTDYEKGMAYAADKNLPVVIDFTGFGCVNCRKMEAAVWTDPNVTALLKNEFVLISLFVDDKTALAKPFQVMENGRARSINTVGDKWSYLQAVRFGANAQPFYVMLDKSGTPLNKSYAFDNQPEHFVKWLKRQ